MARLATLRLALFLPVALGVALGVATVRSVRGAPAARARRRSQAQGASRFPQGPAPVAARSASPGVPRESTKPRSAATPLGVCCGVFVAELSFGLWAGAQGLLPNDGISRAVNALTVLHGADPHLAAIGFVWMPLPSLLELLWMPLYSLWPQIISSGFASVATTSLAAAASAAILVATSRRLGLSDRVGVTVALLAGLNPMLFWYGANGMSEGVAAPFLIGAMCAMTLFWHSGHRRYVAIAGLALAFAFASTYEAVPFGAALAATLVGSLLWGAHRPVTPQGQRAAVWALSTVLVLPAVYVGALWVAANAVIMRDPFYFATSAYSNKGQTETAGQRTVFEVAGQPLDVLLFVGGRTAPFLLPVLALLLIRALDRRLRSVQTGSLLLLTASVPLGLFAPLLLVGASFGWLRFFMYPLFVAVGWALYEISRSPRRRRATAIVVASWVLAAPAALAAMADTDLAHEENLVVRVALSAHEKGSGDAGALEDMRLVVRALENGPLRRGEWVAVDPFFTGFAIPALVAPEHLQRLLLASDRRFPRAILNPGVHGVRYLLVPRPSLTPQDAIVRAHPELWHGRQPGFELVHSFPDTSTQWRLYRVSGAVAAPTALEDGSAARESAP